MCDDRRAIFVHDRLHQALGHARRHQWLLAVMFIDLDRFKHVNDTLGHEGGASLLAQAAKRLKGCLRDSDTVARVGGDEFVVLLLGLIAPMEFLAVAEATGLTVPLGKWVLRTACRQGVD